MPIFTGCAFFCRCHRESKESWIWSTEQCHHWIWNMEGGQVRGRWQSHNFVKRREEEGRMMAKATSNVSHRRDRGCQMQSVSVVVTPPLQYLTLTTSPRPLALTGSSTYLYTWGNVMNDTIYYLREALKIKAVISLDKVCSNVRSMSCFISLFPLPLSCLASFQWCYNVLHICPLLLPCQLYKIR